MYQGIVEQVGLNFTSLLTIYVTYRDKVHGDGMQVGEGEELKLESRC